ncbi:PASTA domain-containing protein [Streptococcus rifensis]
MPVPVKAITNLAKIIIPFVKKRMTKDHNAKEQHLFLGDLTGMRLSDAIAHVERIGFIPQLLLVQPDKKWLKSSINDVLEMQPKSGHYPPETLVKLYYMDENIREQCDEQVDLPVLKGLTLEAAKELLESKGFKVNPELAAPHKDYAEANVRCVVDFEPKPALFTTSLKRGTTITLYYTTQTTIAKSQQLLQEEMSKQGTMIDGGGQNMVDRLNEFFNKFGKK